jgi:hypothetical protein
MKSLQVKLVIIDGCGSELIDLVTTTVNYELSGDGSVLVHTDNLKEATKLFPVKSIKGILNYLNDPKRNDSGPVSIPYEGLILLRC